MCWDHFNGGIPSHFLLQDKDLPEISNAWGGIILPLLTWLLISRIEKRKIKFLKSEKTFFENYKDVIYGFIGALAFGIIFSLCFIWGYKDYNLKMILGLVAIATFYQIYRSEFILGLVLGMSYTFGVVLPLAFALIFSLIGFIVFKGITYLLKKYIQDKDG